MQQKRKVFGIAGACTLAMILAVGCGTSSAGSTSGNTSPSTDAKTTATTDSTKWITSDASTKSATLTLDAGVNKGMNFDGYALGGMTVTVPQGWKVKVDFANQGDSNDSALVVPSSQVSGSSFTPAFSGASTSDPTAGVKAGGSETFTFTADKAGKYAIVSGIPGHVSSGEWVNFVVSSSASSASVTTQN